MVTGSIPVGYRKVFMMRWIMPDWLFGLRAFVLAAVVAIIAIAPVLPVAELFYSNYIVFPTTPTVITDVPSAPVVVVTPNRLQIHGRLSLHT